VKIPNEQVSEAKPKKPATPTDERKKLQAKWHRKGKRKINPGNPMVKKINSDKKVPIQIALGGRIVWKMEKRDMFSRRKFSVCLPGHQGKGMWGKEGKTSRPAWGGCFERIGVDNSEREG